jgi:hypothetical protein
MPNVGILIVRSRTMVFRCFIDLKGENGSLKENDHEPATHRAPRL